MFAMGLAGYKWCSRVGRLVICWYFRRPCAVRGFGGKVALAQIGARNGHFLIKDLLAGAPELALARLGLDISGLSAGAPELALARLGPEMLMF